jgi:hypothetical protein
MPISRNCRARSKTKLRWPHGTEYLLARACKDHDCADNNTVLLYSAAQGVVYGKANRQRRSTLIGAAARGGQRIGSFVAGRMAAESITNGAISDAKSSQAYLKLSDYDRRRACPEPLRLHRVMLEGN